MIELDGRQTLILAVLVLFLGRGLTRRFALLREYNIPEPVSGGVVASLIFTVLHLSTSREISFDLASRDTLLVAFFTTIGLSSRLENLRKGGLLLIILLVLAVVFLFLQNLTGIGIMTLLDLPDAAGVLGGSVSLSGGHGTAIAWAGVFSDEYGIDNALEIGIACATFGLVLGGLAGGPIAKYLITRHGLQPADFDEPTVGLTYEEEHTRIDVDNVLSAILIIAIAMGLGLELNDLIRAVGIELPAFVTSLFAGIVLTNAIPLLVPRLRWPIDTPSMALISDISLSLFLSMSLMSLQLWTLIGLGWPLLLLLATQTVVTATFALLIVFNCMGRNYDAAVISSGYAGLALGATPTAMANMTAVVKSFGGSTIAFIVVPLVGAFFIDIANALIIKSVLHWL